VNRASLLAARSGHAEGRVAPVTLGLSLQCTWALLCGYLAAGLEPGDGVAFLRLVAIWLLADATMGYALAQLIALKSCARDDGTIGAQQAAASSNQPSSSLRMALPYTVPGAPGARFAWWLSHMIDQSRNHMGLRALSHGLAALLTSGLALVVATYLGREILALVGGGLFVASCVMVLSGRNAPRVRSWFAGLHVALAWILGYVVLAPCSNPALGLAALVGLGTWARARLEQGGNPLARWVLAAIQALGVSLLLLRGQPVLAAALAIVTLGERMQAMQFSLRGRLAWLLSMALLGLGARYWD
jgi:hypothetical protein